MFYYGPLSRNVCISVHGHENIAMNICSDPVVYRRAIFLELSIPSPPFFFHVTVFIVNKHISWLTSFLRFFYSWFSETVEVSRTS